MNQDYPGTNLKTKQKLIVINMREKTIHMHVDYKKKLRKRYPNT